MNAPSNFNAFLSIDFANHIGASVLLLIALAILRSKKSLSRFNHSLQMLCLAALLMQLVAAAASIGEPHPTLYAAGLLLSSTIWTLSLLKLIETGRKKPILGWLRIAALCVLAASALALLKAAYSGQAEAARAHAYALLYSIYPPIILNALLSLAALSIKVPAFAKDCRLLLLGSLFFLLLELMHLFIDLTLLKGISLVTYFHGFAGILISLLFVAGCIRHTPAQSFRLSRPIIIFGSIAAPVILVSGFLFIAGAYIGQTDVRWSGFLQLAIVAFALSVIYSLSMSDQFRNRVRVFVNKNFFRHKYDYRNVWLNLIQTLSSISDESDFSELSLQAIGEIFDAKAGAMWLLREENEFDLSATWHLSDELAPKVVLEENFLAPFLQEEWIYALTRSGHHEHDRHLKAVPHWLRSIPNGWIIAPLLVGRKLVGFFMLCKPQQNEALIWEDIDVIKSAGKQLASYILRQQSAEQLAESKQFDTYNKLTAFIMHDLKNLIAQQALVVENAKKHKENPAFVEDAIRTIDNSVDRMSHLLKRLQRNTHQTSHRSVSVKSLLLEAIRKCADRQPIPTLRSESEDAFVVADQDQLVMILMHIVRNAQDATDNEGFIDINVSSEENAVMIEVEDNGCGMDEEFLNNRLFKPFESTKSSMGMGIGAYQVREFIQAMSGSIQVISEVDVGTTVCIKLPIAYVDQ
ncbi:MAG: PEP-CTERM system histidine kinase PrsK [Gammaproteobacteria bacterium]|nr:PEP-CTERM system histidine kinase PrsK [Gammaproteobacteria bacterium]NND39271.1 PEP-CTERM system histidine kinase PrsK [Pseudomonadales bacterium]NNL10700.1 PEP-CTERM system histidine kinase PrsK [Pseudomonadales bacterium]NNM10690.1 PEP-CTERM system histidine kinase PrsK [Pseudomonadales bacterium]RZV53840.1 MAG: PEP-CTERM system histidine kinase PrsK [Pseudomonadales bacterium]